MLTQSGAAGCVIQKLVKLKVLKPSKHDISNKRNNALLSQFTQTCFYNGTKPVLAIESLS